MTPAPQECRPSLGLDPREQETAPAFNDESIVISGMSGLFPASGSVKEFSEILYTKGNPVNNDIVRWMLKHPLASEYVGKIPGIDCFDAQFFMVHKRLGDAMDPMARKVLEQSYQAIYDAGLSPKHLNGKKVGVYIAAAFSDSENLGFFNTVSKTGYGITGTSKTMYANRVSYWLNAKGPSMTIDDACCGSVVALEEAFKAINSGIIEAAIVGGTNICLAPHSLIHFKRCIRLSSDGKTKSFDQNADGCTKSEAVSVIFLQKAKDAVRAYAEVIHVKNEFISRIAGETGQVFGFVRNPATTAEFLNAFYSEARVPPRDVEYIEACGSATPEADKAELESIEKVFCDNRSDPLLVGSVISNIGFTDAASGATAITKVLLGYHNGLLASNLHCETPRQDIPALQDGRMSLVTDHRQFRGTYAAVNCLSFTGVNSHVLLRGCSKPKDPTKYKTSIPRLLTISARQEEYLEDIFTDLKSRPIDAEELALLQNIHSTNVSGHIGRGYIILDTDAAQKTVSLSEHTAHSDESNRPLWFVYSGMGSQWAGMGAQLMRIPIFAAAIERCNKVLKPEGIDIVHIITSADNKIFDNVLNSFLGIAAVQIGITDLLTALGLRPDKIIGHSVGELGCAYADGCLTAEEMIFSAFSRGSASNDATLIRGAMAAVGLGYQELSKICPPSIDIACHNSSTSSTISGPVDSVREFVAMLTAKGVFAKEVPSANIAYHSRYIANAGPYLLKLVSDVIKEPKARSERWLSTSVPQDRWDEPAAKYCSAEYLTNNLLSPVLFEETCSLIPSNAVLIEIAPHGLLQAILKRALPESCKNIPLTHRGHKDNAQFLLDAIGKLYIEGYNPQVQEIYPKVEFPVSTGTPHLAQFVKWNHSESWVVGSQGGISIKLAASCKVLVSIHDEEHSYLTGNVVQGKILYPFAGALVAVWDTLAMTLGCPKKKISVRFQDVHFYSQPILHDQKQLNLNVSLHRGSGQFEVLDGDSRVATGYILILESSLKIVNESNENFSIDSNEVYKHLRSRGYSYKDDFQSIARIDETLTAAQIVWNDNWVTFIDGLLQLNDLRCTYEGVSQAAQIRDLTIDVNKHAAVVQQDCRQGATGKTVVRAEVDDVFEYTKCGGVKMQNIKFLNLPFINQDIFKLKTSADTYADFGLTEKLSADKNYVLQIANVGELDSLHWEEAPAIPENGVKVLVEYAGINISDVKRATGVIPYEETEKYYGMDFSGFTSYGERVMGLVRNGAASTMVSAHPDLLWPVPAHWTLEEAATVPLAYTQAFYYLCIKNELQRGWKVLIHGAAGALGQAAISIALAHGCKVFATVSDSAKKKFLLKLFPELNEDAIGNSRDHTFGDMVLNATNGDGCNIIISCVRDDLKNISLKCAAFSGVTIDMVQIQDRDRFEYGMFNMTKQRSYIAADFYSVLDSGKTEIFKNLQTLISVGITRGYVRPLSLVTFAPGEAARAFRLLAASRHRGRALLRLRDPLAPVTPRIVCSSDKIQLIIWDGSSFGLQLADRLMSRGAKKLHIYCLKPIPQPLLKLRLWKKIGVVVKLLPNQLTDTESISRLLDEILALESSIEGVYVSVTDVDDVRVGVVAKLIDDLDIISRKLQPALKYFAVISVDTNVGKQTCLSRAKDGLPAMTLTLPAYIKENNNSDALIEETAWNRSAIDITEHGLRSKHPVLLAQRQAVEKPSLLKIISAFGENISDNTRLKDLALGESLASIQIFLRDVYHVSLDDNKIMMLTKKKIQEIEMNAIKRNVDKVKGLRTFFSVDHHDELRATSDLIPMRTLVCHVETMEGAIDASQTHLFIVPGLEGLHFRFRALCERLKLPALVLQPGLERQHKTSTELARTYAKILLNDFKLNKNFYLLGYEFGIVVALELAAILEDHGLTGTVYCIGDGPDEMKALLESELSLFDSETALQEGICRHIFSMMAHDSAMALESALRDCSTWQERVDACVRSLRGVPQTAQHIRSFLEAAYARISMARRAVAAPRALRSRIVLLRTRREGERGSSTCSLQRYSQQALLVRELASSMAYAAADLGAPAIINQYLDKDLLEKYENSNLCYSYLI